MLLYLMHQRIKIDIVRGINKELQKFHLKVWYNEFSLNVGDSLLKSINEGYNILKFRHYYYIS